MSDQPGRVHPAWARLRARIKDQISDFYEHEACPEACPHQADDALALGYMVGYIAEIIHEEGFTPPEIAPASPSSGDSA